MAGSLEAKLIISAQDRTKAAFDAIMRRFETVVARGREISRVTEVAERSLSRVGTSMSRVEQSLGAAARVMEGATRSMEAAAKSMERAAAATARAGREGGALPPASRIASHGPAHRIARGLASGRSQRHLARHEVVEGGYSGGGIGGAIATYAGFELGERAVEENAKRQHERVRMDIGGMTPAEMKEAEPYAARLAAQFPQVDQNSIMHTLRNARSITGSYDDAQAISADIMRMRIVAQAAKPDRDIEHETDLLLKAMEQHGDTRSYATFHDAISRINRVLAVEGDTLGPADIYQGAKISRQALPTLSPRFLYGAAPGLMQEMGGSSFGNAMSSFNRAFVTGRMDGRALQTALDLGLVDQKDVEFSKGHPTHLKPLTKGGHGIHNWQAAASDPDRFIYDTLVPALKAHGITDPNEIAQVSGILMSNRMAGDFVNKFLTQRDRIEKNQANLAKAPDDPAARIMANDPTAAWLGVKNAFDNLAAAIPVAGGGVTGALNAISTAMNDKAASLQGVTTDNARRMENQQKYGVDSDRDFSGAPVDELVEAKRKALEADLAKLTAAKLELKGLMDEVAARNKDRPDGILGWLGFGGRETATLITRVHGLRAQIADMETAAARLRELGEAYEALKRAREQDPHALLINRAGGASVPGFGHAAFPLGSTYGNVDPSTGRNWGIAPPPSLSPSPGAGEVAQRRIVNALTGSPFGNLSGAPSGPIEAQLRGSVDIQASFSVLPGSQLLEVVRKAQSIVSNTDLINTQGRSFGMKTGAGAQDTGPHGRQP